VSNDNPSPSAARPSGPLDLLERRSGHFQLESGHHGDLWLELDALLHRPARLAPFIESLAVRIARNTDLDAFCGPLLGGALLASAAASMLDRELYVAEPVAPAGGPGELYRARYAVAHPIRARLAGRRVAVLDDVINAASATRATVADLRSAGATVVALGALLVLGDRAVSYAEHEGVPLTFIESLPNRIWAPEECPLCAAGEPLEAAAALKVGARARLRQVSARR
jgi:orotate phosphoribosyltransferase